LENGERRTSGGQQSHYHSLRSATEKREVAYNATHVRKINNNKQPLLHCCCSFYKNVKVDFVLLKVCAHKQNAKYRCNSTNESNEKFFDSGINTNKNNLE
jgi:hypothetical protein